MILHLCSFVCITSLLKVLPVFTTGLLVRPSYKFGFRSSVRKNGLPGEGRHEGLVPRNDVLTNGFIGCSFARTLARLLFVPRLRFGTPGPLRELKERIIDRCSTWAINKHNLWAKCFTSWRHCGWRLDCKLSYSLKRTTQLPTNVRWILMLRNERPWARDVTTLPY